MTVLTIIIVGLVVFFGLSFFSAISSDPQRINAEESRRVWRKSERARRRQRTPGSARRRA